MSEPIIAGCNFTESEEIILEGFEPRPPGEYLATVEDLTKEGTDVNVLFKLLRSLKLYDSAPTPESLGKIGKRFYHIGPIPMDADKAKKAKNAIGIFRGFWKVATGTSLTGSTISPDKVKGSFIVLAISWGKRVAKGEKRQAYSYSQWLAASKPDPGDTFWQQVSRVR
ncbi:hypothetical protein LCGC14_2902930, partial [marine sediment metagenome]